MNPCGCTPTPPTRPYQTGDCGRCWAWHFRPDVRAAWGGNPADCRPEPKPARGEPADCPHLGREMTGPERQAAGLDHRKRWSLCSHPDQPLGPHVCPCRGCGPGCVGHPAYRPKRDAAVLVPTPPPVTLPPGTTRAVVTVAAGQEGRDLLALSRPWLEAYARRLGAAFVVLTWDGGGWGQANKFQFARVLEQVDRAALIDADTLADPDLVPDLFAAVPPGSVGIYDDLPGILRAGAAALIEEYQQYRVAAGLGRAAVPWYGNTGVVVADKAHAPLFRPPAVPVKPLHCGEQHWWVARLTDAGVPVTSLPAAANYQWWEQDQFKSPPPPHALAHFSGMRPHKSAADRLSVMRAWAARPPR